MNRGFSLIELSIVVVIIALLISGISSGAKLAHNAKVKTVITDSREYQIAFSAFVLKYGELPGDLKDSSALALFGVTNQTRTGSDEVEADGYINAKVEGLMAFWHMKLANLINGSYDAISVDPEIPGTTVGFARYSRKAGFNFFTFGLGANQWDYSTHSVYEKKYKIVIGMGAVSPGTTVIVKDAILPPEDAYMIDKKLDDGKAYRGKVMSDHGVDVGSNKCTTLTTYANDYVSATHGDITYKLTDTEAQCRIMFEIES